MNGRVLIIAGSDSGGGAGIQADIKTVTALGGFAMTAITAVTAQNTLGVQAVHPLPLEIIRAQIESVLGDLGADCIKLGMLHSGDVIDAVALALDRLAPEVPLVVDPVMVAKGGAALLEDSAVAALRTRLIARAHVLTPNVPEAEALTGLSFRSTGDMADAAQLLLGQGAGAVLLKGGHLQADPGQVTDLLVTTRGAQMFTSTRLDTPHTHGTGCTLASAIAVSLAQGMALVEAVARARDYVWQAIASAPGYGHGHGPLNHGHVLDADQRQ